MTTVQRRYGCSLTPFGILEAAARYAAGETSRQIAASFGTSASSICKALRQHGVELRSRSESRVRHPLRHDAFDVLTQEAAYWCGFLFADGSVAYRRNRTQVVSVALSECDRSHIEKFRAFLGSTHKITTMAPQTAGGYLCRPACRYSVPSDRLADRLRALGRYEGPVDADLTRSRDFWRGMVDGDGSIGIARRGSFLKLVGSRRMLEPFVEFLGDTGNRNLSPRPTRNSFVVASGGSTAERIIDRLYDGASVALDRKAARAELIRAHSVTLTRSLPGLELFGR